MPLAAVMANSVWTTVSQVRIFFPTVWERLAPCSAGLGVMTVAAAGNHLSTHRATFNWESRVSTKGS